MSNLALDRILLDHQRRVDAALERLRADVHSDIKRGVTLWWRWFVVPAFLVIWAAAGVITFLALR